MTTDDEAPTPGAQWRVKYDGVCSRCGIALHAGDVAVYERPTRSIRCVVCPDVADDRHPGPAVDAGVAGASARREYERRSANRETKIRGRFGRVGGVVLALTDEPQSTRAWATGARGEEKLAKALEGIEGLVALHDRRAPGTRGNIDHIVLAPVGVFVVDAKDYQGKIEIRDRGWFLRPDRRLYVGRRDRSSLATGLGWQVDVVTAALTAAGVDPLPPVTPVLCFVDGEWPLFSPPDVYAGVRLEGIKSIRKLLTRAGPLDQPSIVGLARLLAAALPPN
ncbi:MAG: NERD domain-containing protein [Chloroflexota bacterium]|nr:NERD domain-containing protein [Chloroflexota bacterium]